MFSDVFGLPNRLASLLIYNTKDNLYIIFFEVKDFYKPGNAGNQVKLQKFAHYRDIQSVERTQIDIPVQVLADRIIRFALEIHSLVPHPVLRASMYVILLCVCVYL